jgi:hypothetical protein
LDQVLWLVYVSQLSPKHLQQTLNAQAYSFFSDRRHAALQEISDLEEQLARCRDITMRVLQYEDTFYVTCRCGLPHDASDLVARFVVGGRVDHGL